MKPKKGTQISEFRPQVEQERSSHAEQKITLLPDADVMQLIHELEVSQMELESQNEDINQIREKLEELLERFTKLYDFAPLGYLTIDRDGTICQTNLNGASLFGLKPADLIGMDFKSFVIEGERVGYNNYLENSGKKQTNDNYRLWLESENGGLFFAQISASLNPKNNKQYFLVISDITEYKHAEDALLESEKKFHLIFEKSGIGISLAALNGDFIQGNPAVNKMFGYTEEEYNHLSIQKISYLEDVDKDINLYKELLDGKRDFYTIEKRNLHKDGHIIWGRLTCSMVRADDGTPLFSIGMFEDVTERRKNEEKIQQMTLYNRSLIEASLDPLVTISPEGKITDVNKATEIATGYPREQLIGTDFSSYFSNPERARTGYQQVIIEGQITDYELELKHKDGSTIFVLYNASIYQNEAGCTMGILAAARNISERKKMEEEKEKLQKMLQKAQNLESIGLLAGGVAHEFNNMLAIIFGNYELAITKCSPEDGIYDKLQKIFKAAKHSAQLTSKLLTYAQKQIITPKVLDVNEAISSRLAQLRSYIHKGITMHWHPASRLYYVQIDPAQLEQVLTNIIVNANDAILDEGNITIECDNVVIDEKECFQNEERIMIGEYIMLSISDDGYGMDKEMLSHIFEPFFTTKDISKGSGLGLPTVYGIVKQNHGFICVTSEVGKGTTFKVYLPIVRSKAAEPNTKKEEVLARRINETLLLVEDEPWLLDLLKEVLAEQNYNVLAADTPREALRLAQEYMGGIHLIITDVAMPGMNGQELVNQIRKTLPALPCLFMSGYSADIISESGKLPEGIYFIQKPFSLIDFTVKIRGIIDQNEPSKIT